MRKVVSKLFGPEEDGKCFEYFEGYCSSDEDKPTELVADGSNLIETDTGDLYMFNEKTATWSVRSTIGG